MVDNLFFTLIIWPFLAGLGCWLLRASAVRSALVIATGAILAVGSVVLATQEPFTYTPHTFIGIGIESLIALLDFALLGVFLYLGFKHKNIFVQIFAAVQILMIGFVEFFMMEHGVEQTTFVVDELAQIMVMVVSIVGSVICIHALPYMQKHEDHLHLTTSKQHKFFLVLILFLGAMNGLVLTNNLLYFYFFFEVTTLCSYLLIGHDQTEIAVKNSVKALMLNSLGGVALALGIVWLYSDLGTMEMSTIIAKAPETAGILLPLALLCLAGFTKSAQAPFQSWLLGAMVAPTPTSALLHSSTMVKAGIYLILRFAPAYMGTFLSTTVALFGAFTFLATTAMAVGQSNGKKILAYSTIANLGLIIACIGINTSEAITAAIMLTVFHAVSKGLLFLCVGTIEQQIDSRDVEDMRGLFTRMPVTAVVTMLAVLTMILPPFGVLLGKWMAIQAASENLFLIVMFAVGSACTVVYWVRWIGTLLDAPFEGKAMVETQPLLTRWPLLFLLFGAFFASGAAPWLYSGLVVPFLKAWGTVPYTVYDGIIGSPTGAFSVVPLIILIAAAVVFGVYFLGVAKTRKVQPYMGGVNNEDITTYNGPMNQPVTLSAGNYYLESIFGEAKLTTWVNYGAGMLILLMVGGAL